MTRATWAATAGVYDAPRERAAQDSRDGTEGDASEPVHGTLLRRRGRSSFDLPGAFVQDRRQAGGQGPVRGHAGHFLPILCEQSGRGQGGDRFEGRRSSIWWS